MFSFSMAPLLMLDADAGAFHAPLTRHFSCHFLSFSIIDATLFACCRRRRCRRYSALMPAERQRHAAFADAADAMPPAAATLPCFRHDAAITICRALLRGR
jgi:hypothetical protein